MELSDLQASVDQWIRDNAGGYWDVDDVRLDDAIGAVLSKYTVRDGDPWRAAQAGSK